MALSKETWEAIDAALQARRVELESGQASMAQVAEDAGIDSRHIGSMYRRATGWHRFELKHGRRTVLDHELVLSLYGQGLRVVDIQRELNHPNRQAIDKIVKQHLDDKLKK